MQQLQHLGLFVALPPAHMDLIGTAHNWSIFSSSRRCERTIYLLLDAGRILLQLIQAQTGSYLGEDDIIRIEDEFGRA